MGKRVRPTQVLRGRDEAENWLTAHAKEYPHRLSAALALAMIDEALHHPVKFQEHNIDEVLAKFETYMPPLDPYLDTLADYGADYVESILPIHSFKAKWQLPPGA